MYAECLMKVDAILISDASSKRQPLSKRTAVADTNPPTLAIHIDEGIGIS